MVRTRLPILLLYCCFDWSGGLGQAPAQDAAKALGPAQRVITSNASETSKQLVAEGKEAFKSSKAKDDVPMDKDDGASGKNSEAGLPTEREEEVKRVEDFVRKHEPQLAKLLRVVKQRGDKPYLNAIHELHRAIARIEALEKRDSELYAIELRLWKTRSQLRLLAAQIAVNTNIDREQTEKQLKTLVENELSQELERLRLLQARAQAQSDALGEQIATREQTSEAIVEKSMKMWENRIRKQRPAVVRPKRY